MQRDDEQHRHRCEVRQLLRWRVQHGRDWVRDWLQSVERGRGAGAAERLRSDCHRQWQLGNRGCVTVTGVAFDGQALAHDVPFGTDPRAATRRAIVLVAADMAN